MKKAQWVCRSIFFSLLLILSFSVCCPLVAGAEEPKKIKVGYLENYSMSTNPDTGKQQGYSYDYFMEIAKYTGWDYEFISLGWSEGLEKLAAGEIDLFGPVQKTLEREQVYDYPNREMGYEYGTIYVSENNDKIHYNDIASFDGMSVATETGNFYNMRMREYCRDNDIKIKNIFTDPALFHDGLENGDFDAVIFGSLMDIPNTVVVAKISAEPYYFATTKGNQPVLDGLNLALEKIQKDNVYFAADLDRKYFAEKSVSMLAYTKEETAFIEEHPTLRVACAPALAPIEYYDNETNTYQGISIDILNELGKTSGLSFSYLSTSSYEESLRLLESGKADMLLSYASQAESLPVHYTDPFLQVPILLLSHTPVDLTKEQSVAMPNLNTATSLAIMEQFPHFRYIDKKNQGAALASIRSNQENLTFINAYSYDELSRRQPSTHYIPISTGITMPLCVGVSDQISPVAVEMLNKSIRRLKLAQINAIVFANTVNRVYTVPLSRVITENAMGIIVMLVIIFGAFFLVIVHLNHRTQARLKNIAYVDALTGISTLAKFKLDVAERLKTAAPRMYSLSTIDVNNFKYINDSCGYETGDQVLCAIAKHFLANTSNDTLLGRISADNFAFFGRTYTPEEEAEKFARLCDTEPYAGLVLPDHYTLAFSMGIYVVTEPDGDFSLMIDKANLARKSIKGRHNSAFAEYTNEMDLKLRWKKEVTLSMELALLNQEFEVYLQPKYLFDGETIIGAEALARWNYPTKGLLSPAAFIPIFEQNGFIRSLDLYIFDQVCELLHKWEKNGMNKIPITISVNLSRLHLNNPALVEDMIALTQKHDISPNLLEIELTESIMFHNTTALIKVMGKLKAVGFHISIDDFGSGYSSLNLLKDMPVDVLKLDKEFLGASVDDRNGRIIIGKVIEMAKSLRLVTVAEGVETKEQVDMLASMGCDIAQGYYYAKPMPVESFEKLLL